MPGKQTFEQIQSHVGGLVRVAELPSWRPPSVFSGKIGLLIGVAQPAAWSTSMTVEMLIDGSVNKLLLYPNELEFLGADDV